MRAGRILKLGLPVLVSVLMVGSVMAATASDQTCKFTKIKPIQPNNPPGVIKLNELDKYMKVDKNHNVHFNYQAAIRDGVHPVKVYFGLQAAALINRMVQELRNNGKISDDTSKEIDSLFGPSF